jgi:hypothetical protein
MPERFLRGALRHRQAADRAGPRPRAVGVLVLLGSKGMLLRLPGNFSFQSGGVRIYIPLATSLLLSIVLTIVLNLILRR